MKIKNYLSPLKDFTKVWLCNCFLLSTCVGHSAAQSILLVMLFTVQQIHSNFKPSCQKKIKYTLRYHKISFDTLNTLETGNIDFLKKKLSVLHDQTSLESL